MVLVRHKSSLSASGPWLVDENALCELESIVVAQAHALEAETAARSKPPPGESAVRSDPVSIAVTAQLDHDIVIHGATCAELNSAPELQYSLIRKLTFQLHAGLSAFEVHIGSGSSSTLEASAPPDREDSQRFLAAIRLWIDRHEAPWWQRVVRRMQGVQWIVLLMVFIAAPDPTSRQVDDTRAERAAQIQTVLADGVSASEVPMAVELLLADQLPRETLETPNPRYAIWGRFLVLAVACSIALAFWPKVVIGKGRGIAAMKRWRAYMWGIASAGSVGWAAFGWPWIERGIRALF